MYNKLNFNLIEAHLCPALAHCASIKANTVNTLSVGCVNTSLEQRRDIANAYCTPGSIIGRILHGEVESWLLLTTALLIQYSNQQF